MAPKSSLYLNLIKPNIYTNTVYSPQLETINMDHPDFMLYPALQLAEGISVEMKHGDALHMSSGYWHYITYNDGGFSITLRAFPRNPLRLAKLFKNIVFMRSFENAECRVFGQGWVDYKETQLVNKMNRNYKKQHPHA